MTPRALLQTSPIVPVLTIQDAAISLDLARALIRGGIRVLEITLRTPAALDAIRLIADELPEAIVGAGTVINAAQLEAVLDAGAHFAISPGVNEKFLREAQDLLRGAGVGGAGVGAAKGEKDGAGVGGAGGFALIPGVATAGELMLALEYGYEDLKFFPAQAAGGVELLRSLAGPFAGVKFCPTGGVSLANIKAYLALPNVLCVGGSWLAPAQAVEQGRWDELTRLTRESLDFLRG